MPCITCCILVRHYREPRSHKILNFDVCLENDQKQCCDDTKFKCTHLEFLANVLTALFGVIFETNKHQNLLTLKCPIEKSMRYVLCQICIHHAWKIIEVMLRTNNASLCNKGTISWETGLPIYYAPSVQDHIYLFTKPIFQKLPYLFLTKLYFHQY